MDDNENKEIDALRSKMQAIHDSGVNLTAEWRIDQLQRLQRLVNENEDAIRAALYADLGKEWTEATISEICTVQEEIALCLKQLRKWMKPRAVPSPGISFPARSKIVPMPLAPPGVFIMGPSNYPFSLCLHPAVGSLAAGNPTLIKPSELCLATCELLQKLVPRYFGTDNAALQVILSDTIPKTTKLLSREWGCIFFTGSVRVGRIVAAAAAQTLTKVILELGGKTPCIVDETCPLSSTRSSSNDASLQQIAHRIVWAKLFNTGQTCAAVDYMLVHESVAPALIDCLQKAIRTQFPSGGDGDNNSNNVSSSELGRILCRDHAQRHLELIQQVEAQIASSSSSSTSTTKIVMGGSKDCDVASRYIAPTIVINPPEDCRLMTEEIFGPILPVITVKSRQQAMDTVRRVSGMAPLCLYVFTKYDSVLQEYMNKCRAGGVVRNDCLVHLASHELPFGGLGTSGYGQYHGKYSFDAFSQALPVVYRPVAFGMDMCMARYHPLVGIKGKILARVLMKVPYIPVLKPALVTAVLAAMVRFVIQKHGLLFVASALEELASWIRQQKEEQ